MRMIYSMKRKVALVVACIMCSLTASAAEGDVASVTVGETTTNYTSLDDALIAAQNNPDSTLTLLQNIDRGSDRLLINSIPNSTFTIDLNGCTLTSTGNTVYINTSVTLTIVDSKGTGGIISNNNGIYINWNDATVNIIGVTITTTATLGYEAGVYINASNATVNIIDSTINSRNVGVYGGGTLNISGDTRITTTSSNMAAIHRTGGALTINGGSITGGVYVAGGTADIIGGTITEPRDYYNAVDVANAQVTISGGSISGVNADLYVGGSKGILNLTLGEGKTVGATFPEGITVEGTTLAELLATDTAAYWGVVDGKDTMLTVADDATSITDKGDITIRAICDHSGNTNKPADAQNGTHSFTCTVCQTAATEDHTLTDDASDNVITNGCSKCEYVTATASITATDATYDGTAQETATVAYGTGWTGDRGLTPTYENNVDAGTATASITIGGVTARTTFTIQPKEITGAAVAIEQGASFVYSGEPFTPAVSVTLDGKPLAASDYQVSYAGNVNAGQAMVTVTGRGNYSGSATATFTIAKAPAPTLPAATVSRNYAVAKVSVPTGIVAGEGSSVSVGTASGSGSDKVAAVALDAKGNLTFTLSGGADGDEIVLPVHLHSPNYEGPITATVTVTLTDKLDQRPLTVKATSTTVPSGGSLELSIGGGSGKGAVTYEVINGTGSASLSGSTLTGGAPGTVTVIATKAGTSQYNPARSQPLVVTIE